MPCPEGILIYLSQEFLDINPVLQSKFNTAIKPGWYFGSEQLKEAYDNPPPSIISRISNKNDLPIIIVFDILMLNIDRNNHSNYLIVKLHTSPEQLRLHVIDNGHCLGGSHWNNEYLLGQSGNWNPNVIHEMAQSIDRINPFTPALEKLNELSVDYIKAIVAEIPEAWGVTDDEKTAVIEFINGHKTHVGRILQENCNLFPLWRG